MQKLCELFMKEKGEEYLFAHCFLTLEWNLMTQLENIVFAHLFHITWEDDCLVFDFQEEMGRNKDQLWHVYCFLWRPLFLSILASLTGKQARHVRMMGSLD